MEGFEGRDLQQFGANPEGNIFDASQYAFFGNDVVEEVELGGLEDEEEDTPHVEFDEEEYRLDFDEGEALGSLSEVDDLTNTFSELNRAVSDPRSAGMLIDRGSRESSSVAEWMHETGFPNPLNQHAFESASSQESKRWSSLQYLSVPDDVNSKPLHRTSSYPEQQQHHQLLHQQPQHHQLQHSQQQYASEPVLIPKNTFTSFPPQGFNPQKASAQSHYTNIPHPPSGHQMSLSSPNHSPFSSHQLQMNAAPHGLRVGGNLPQLTPSDHPVNNLLQNRWGNQNSVYPGDHPSLSNNKLQQLQPSPMHPNLMLQQQAHQPSLQHPSQQPFGHFSGPLSGLYNKQNCPAPFMMNDFDMPALGDLRDQRAKPMLRGSHGIAYPPQGWDTSSQRTDNFWPRFQSKYMTANEIENILRMQLAATHTNDPYVDDYYHQSCLAKKTAGAKRKHHFCPTNLRDGSPRANPNSEPHAFLQVDALGRVAFASIRRPRPLLEVESAKTSSPCSKEQIVSEKPLGQEPMLAARVTIEDSLCLLLDVDDIDRFLEFNQLQDGGTELRRRRQVLLEGLATSLQLVDPLGKNGHTVDLAPMDDFVFLRLVSLPKGRKLLLRYLEHLSPEDELIRVVCMAILRHLKFLFGSPVADPGTVETISKLANTVSSCINGMDLKALAACLASVVCSAEHPPLRPLGSSAGNGGSVILKSVLERATELLRDPHYAGNCSMPNRAFWQASFDAFFGLLTKYCFNKYDTIMQSFLLQSRSDVASDAARLISREMPVELLRACLPHTNEQQRKLLSDFAQRSMPVSSAN